MRLHSLRIEGYKRMQSATVVFGDATFLIGPNNSGKTSVLSAIERLLSPNKQIPDIEYFCIRDEATGEQKPASGRIVLEAEFRNVLIEAKGWRGFKGRVREYEHDATKESGLCLTYRKTYELGKDVVVEVKSRTRTVAAAFEDIKTPQDLVDGGVDPAAVTSLYPDLAKKLTQASRALLEDLDEIWVLGDEETWVQNPGGIPQVVLARLPRFLLIPAGDSSHEMSSSGVLGKTLNELFEDVRAASDNYKKAQEHLDALAKELDPQDASSEFGKMLAELNEVIAGVFPESSIHANADLSDPNKSLKPTFTVTLSSNVRTPVDHQGTGTVRAAVFGVLRFRQRWMAKRQQNLNGRSLIIGFEEPELYLHPSAANQMRDTIYDLSLHDHQIVATTHSPFLIDISRKPRQVLNRFAVVSGGVQVQPFSVSDAFAALQDDDKDYVKMLLRIDDYIARVFFARRVVIVEGDTEDVIIRESLKRLDPATRQSAQAQTEVVKARGKASIIGLTRYLRALGMIPFVIHDLDSATPNAAKFNAPIAAAAGPENVAALAECIEDVLGYAPPSHEKPLTAFREATKWGQNWADVPKAWRDVMARAFHIPN
ncbi:MAG: AAA family ATPase [Gemmatimonadetes bacterium]|nr:AAA family ATPase [Gemmatimonadota bacterium]